MIYEFLKDQTRHSAVLGAAGAVMTAAGSGIARAGRKSRVLGLIGPVFARDDMLLPSREGSVICSAASVVFSALIALLSRIWRAFSNVPPFNQLTKFAAWLIGLPSGVLGAALLSVTLCVDDSRWNNGYMLVMAAFAGLLYLLGFAEGRERKRAKLPVSLFIFIGVSAIAVFTGIFVPEAARTFSYFATSFMFMLCFAGTVKNFRDLRRVFIILVAPLLFTSVFGIMQFINGIAVSTSYTDVANNSGMPGRAYATFFNPNNFAEIILLLTPCCFVSVMAERSITRPAKILLGICFILPALALLMTYCRAGWISFALTVGSFIALTNVKLIPIFLALAAIAVPVLPRSIINRVLSIFNGKDTSIEYRLFIWEGTRDALLYNPLSGGGLGMKNFYDAYRKFMLEDASVATHAHNLFLEIWIETGAVGVLSFVLFYLSTLKNTLLAALRGERGLKYIAAALFSTLFGMLFIEMVEYIWFYPRVMLVFWSTLGLAWALVRIVRETGSGADS